MLLYLWWCGGIDCGCNGGCIVSVVWLYGCDCGEILCWHWQFSYSGDGMTVMVVLWCVGRVEMAMVLLCSGYGTDGGESFYNYVYTCINAKLIY